MKQPRYRLIEPRPTQGNVTYYKGIELPLGSRTLTLIRGGISSLYDDCYAIADIFTNGEPGEPFVRMHLGGEAKNMEVFTFNEFLAEVKRAESEYSIERQA